MAGDFVRDEKHRDILQCPTLRSEFRPRNIRKSRVLRRLGIAAIADLLLCDLLKAPIPAFSCNR